jgi:uncharacterized protein YidB (DUF937 family)
MGLFDNVVPGGNLSKPLGIALLALLAYRATHRNQQQGEGGGGGLLGGLGGLLGGLTQQGGAQQAPMPQPQREQAQAAIPEGLNGLVERFRQGGLGGLIDSWIGTGANQPIAPNQLNQALEPHEIDELSRQTGLPEQEVLSQLSRALPDAVDRLTPQGRIPQPAEMSRW